MTYKSSYTGKEIDYTLDQVKTAIPAQLSDIDNEIKNLQENKAGKDIIPTKISQLENDSGFVSSKAQLELDKVDNTPDAEKSVAYATDAGYAERAQNADSAVSADSAMSDWNGNNIVDTYATKDEVSEVEAIAKGRATGYVFDTVDDMNTWLSNADNLAKLVLGDNLYIKAVDVPDYWWDGTQAQQLETQKVDLSEYAKITKLNEHTANTANPHNVTKAQIGLDKVDNTPDAKKKVAYANGAGYAAGADTAGWDDMGNYIYDTYATKGEVSTALGDISTALDSIIALQNSYIGGASV